MGHFARVNDNGRVDAVIVVNNEVIGEPEKTFPETETLGQEFISDVLKLDGTWLQTSYNNNFRSNYAGIGGEYDAENDVFIPVQPYDSWILNQEFKWEAPIEYPADGLEYYWDERLKSWEQVPS